MWTFEEFMGQIKDRIYGDYVVRIMLKYDYEEQYREITTIMTIRPDDQIEWLDDWNEGEKCVFILGYIWIEDIYSIAVALIDLKLSGNTDKGYPRAIKSAKEYLGTIPY